MPGCAARNRLRMLGSKRFDAVGPNEPMRKVPRYHYSVEAGMPAGETWRYMQARYPGF